MIAFADSPLWFRVALMTAQFLLLCFGVGLLPKLVQQRYVIPKILVPLGTLVSGAMMVVYSALVRSEKMHMELPEATRWVSAQAAWMPTVLVVAILLYFVYVVTQLCRARTITRAAIKESVDRLPVGLCFCYENGRTILINHQMHALAHILMESDLQNAELFWDRLVSGAVADSCCCLETGETPIFRLPNRRVWAFARENVDGVIQISATEITCIQEITEELKVKKKDLDTINRRLRQYGENVDELTRTKERLETKAHIHRELGRALLVTRKFVLGTTDQTPFESWETLVAVLQMENATTEEDLLEMFLKAAGQAGVRVEMEGSLPTCPSVRNLVISAAVESLVNAVRHAEATALYIDITADGGMNTVRFTNNGAVPAKPVTEGGGLGSLRVKTESVGGIMKVEHEPVFALTLIVPSERGDDGCIVS